MKKSNKKEKKQKPDPKDLNPEEILKDADKILNFIDEFESIDHNTADLSELEKRVNNIQKNFRKKYGEYLPEDFDEKLKEDIEEDLDTEK